MSNESTLISAGFRKAEENSNDWVYSSGIIFFRGYYQNLESSENFVFFINLEIKENKSELLTFLDDAKAKGKIREYGSTGDNLSITFNLNEYYSEFNSFVESLISMLKNCSCESECDTCNNKNFLNHYVSHEGIKLLCPDCANALETKIQKELTAPNNYGVGFFAALLGALVCSALWILIGAFGWVASFAGFVMAFGAVWAYKKVGGKVNKVGIVLIVITLLFSLLLAEYVSLAIMIAKESEEYGFFTAMFVIPFALTDSEFLIEVLKSIGLGLLFAIWGSYKLLKSEYDSNESAQNHYLRKII